MKDYKANAKVSREGKMRAMGCYEDGGTVIEKKPSGKGSMPEKYQSRYGGADLPTAKPGSNEDQYYRNRAFPGGTDVRYREAAKED